MKRHDRTELDDEQLYQTATVLSVLCDPESIRVLGRLAVRPACPAQICAAEPGLDRAEVSRILGDFGAAGLAEPLAKGDWYQLTHLGRLAVRAVRQLLP